MRVEVNVVKFCCKSYRAGSSNDSFFFFSISISIKAKMHLKILKMRTISSEQNVNS